MACSYVNRIFLPKYQESMISSESNITNENGSAGLDGGIAGIVKEYLNNIHMPRKIFNLTFKS